MHVNVCEVQSIYIHVRVYMYMYIIICTKVLSLYTQCIHTWGRYWSEPFSSAVLFLKKTWISLFSLLVVRSRVERESALSSHLAREKVNATSGSLSFFCSIRTSDSHTLFSCDCQSAYSVHVYTIIPYRLHTQLDGWVDGWMDGWMDVCTCMVQLMYIHVCTCTYVCTCSLYQLFHAFIATNLFAHTYVSLHDMYVHVHVRTCI